MPYVNELGSSMATTIEGLGLAREPKKLVLCFDGTGNTFTGSNADTNVVKLLNKLDRNDPHQYHYYQCRSVLSPVSIPPLIKLVKLVSGRMISMRRP